MSYVPPSSTGIEDNPLENCNPCIFPQERNSSCAFRLITLDEKNKKVNKVKTLGRTKFVFMVVLFNVRCIKLNKIFLHKLMNEIHKSLTLRHIVNLLNIKSNYLVC